MKVVTIRIRIANWEIECTGPREWVEKTIKVYILKVRAISK